MRQLLFLLLFCTVSAISAQSVAINSDGSTAHSSAILDVKSTTKGLLAPRMTTTQLNAIASPAEGLLVYDTNLGTYFYRTASAWKAVNIAISLADGDDNTKIQVEKTPNDNTIRFDINGNERMTLLENANGVPRLEISDNLSLMNTYIGKSAGASNTTGHHNTVLGYLGMTSNTTGYWNTAIGFGSLVNNTIGSSNLGIGLNALNANTNGSSNIGIGIKSLVSNSSGAANIAIGNSSLYYNTTGYLNMAIGGQALYSNTIGNLNTAIGDNVLQNSTSGTSNIGMGYSALYENSTGSKNIGIGVEALRENGTSTNNIAIGYQAGRDFQNGSNNTFLGTDAESNAAGFTNSTAIGYQSTVSASNQIRIGNASVGSIGGFQNWTNVSDARLKDEVQADVPGLEFINRLRPVTYVLNRDKIRETFGQEAAEESLAGRSTGFLAQEVEAAANATRFEFSGVDMPKNEADFYGLRYAEFTVPLVKAVQELHAENQALRDLIRNMQTRLEALEASK